MKLAACFLVGKIVRKHSFKGEVIIKVNSDYVDIISETESVFVTFGDNLIPFFFEKSNWQKKLQFRVQFEDVTSEQDADLLIGKEVYLPNTLLPELEENDFYKDEIIDFKVIDVNYGDVGILRSINDLTPQTLLEVENDEGIILIPSDAFIKNIDRDNQIITIETPEGLLDLRQ